MSYTRRAREIEEGGQTEGRRKKIGEHAERDEASGKREGYVCWATELRFYICLISEWYLRARVAVSSIITFAPLFLHLFLLEDCLPRMRNDRIHLEQRSEPAGDASYIFRVRKIRGIEDHTIAELGDILTAPE